MALVYGIELDPCAPFHVSASSSATGSLETLAMNVLCYYEFIVTHAGVHSSHSRVIIVVLADICSEVELFRFSSLTMHSFTPLHNTTIGMADTN